MCSDLEHVSDPEGYPTVGTSAVAITPPRAAHRIAILSAADSGLWWAACALRVASNPYHPADSSWPGV